jgi:N-[(2S)-2-amino-2-carboxyethyl]-L-glutamate dehydrogenase
VTAVLFLNSSDVVTAAAEIDFVDSVRRILSLHARGQCELPNEAHLSWVTPDGESARSLAMPGAIRDDRMIVGTKLINANPANVARALPRASGVTVLFDPHTGAITCLMEGAYISAMRTAGVTMLSALMCSAAPVRCVALIGAGRLAWAHIELCHKHLPDVEEIRVFDLDPDRARALCGRTAREIPALGDAITACGSSEEAVRGAQLVVPVTTTTTPYIVLDWLADGVVVVNVSLDDVDTEAVLAMNEIFVDDWSLVEADKHRLLGRLAREGRVRGPGRAGPGREVDGELGTLVAGDIVARTSPTDRVLVNPFGLSLGDVGIADMVYQRALDLGLGVSLPLTGHDRDGVMDTVGLTP